MTKSNYLRRILKDKLLLLAIIFSIPNLFIWLSATLSFLYINYIGRFIFSLSQAGEIIVFLLIPAAALTFGIIAYKKKPTMLTRFVIIANVLLLIFILLASLRQS